MAKVRSEMEGLTAKLAEVQKEAKEEGERYQEVINDKQRQIDEITSREADQENRAQKSLKSNEDEICRLQRELGKMKCTLYLA